MTQTEQKETNAIQLTENYKVASIPRNLILQERYETQIGKGKGAQKSGEFSYRDIGYYSNFKVLTNALIEKEIIKAVDEVKGLQEIVDYIEKVKEDVYKHIDSHITVDIGENSRKASTRTVRGVKIDVEAVLENEED